MAASYSLTTDQEKARTAPTTSPLPSEYQNAVSIGSTSTTRMTTRLFRPIHRSCDGSHTLALPRIRTAERQQEAPARRPTCGLVIAVGACRATGYAMGVAGKSWPLAGGAQRGGELRLPMDRVDPGHRSGRSTGSMSRLTTTGSWPLRTSTHSSGSSWLGVDLLVRHVGRHVDEIARAGLGHEFQPLAPAHARASAARRR